MSGVLLDEDAKMFDEDLFISVFLWSMIVVVFISRTRMTVEVLYDIAKVILLQLVNFESFGEFAF